MRLSAGTAYWSFVIASAASAAFGVAAYATASPLSDTVATPFWANGSFVAIASLMATLGYGVFFAMPALRQAQCQQNSLADRAAELEIAAMTDSLTGLHNRRYFEKSFIEYFGAFKASDTPLALLVMDVDRFKSINDTFGHDAGDLVLQKIALCLKKISREHDIVARLGGDEICIVAPFSENAHILPFAERIFNAVSGLEIPFNNVVLRPTISIGVASLADRPDSTKDMMKIADERMYRAKQAGRERVVA